MDGAPESFSGRTSPVSSPSSVEGSSVLDIPKMASAERRPEDSKRSGSRGAPVTFRGPQVIARPRNLAAIPPGTLVHAVLVSGASNGPTRAQLQEAVRVNGAVLIEEGAILVGSGTSTEERLLVRFNQVVFKDGSFGAIDAHACDSSDKIVGLKGSKVGAKALSLAGSIGLGFVGGLSEGLQETRGEQGVLVRKPSLKNALLNATATTALDQSRQMMSDLKNNVPVIEVPSGSSVYVLFGSTN